MDFMFNQAAQLALLGDAVAGHLTGAKLRLSKADVNPTPELPLATYTIANYATYANAAITWSDPTISDDGEVEVIGNVPEFRPTDGVTPNSIYTCQIVDSAGTVLIAAARFPDAPLPMGAVTDAIQVVVRYRPRSGALAVVVS